MLKEDWKKETARDTIALGSLAFYILVIARAFIAPYWDFAYRLIIALAILFTLTIFIKDYEKHIARSVILTILIIIFYNVKIFTIFAIIVFIAIIASAIYLQTKKAVIIKGFILGLICTAIGYYLASPLANLLGLPT